MTPEYGIPAPGVRLSDVALGPVLLQVGDLARSLDYYRDVLGLEMLASSGADAALGAGDRTLVSLRERRGARPAPPRGRHGLYHFAILLPDRIELGRFLSHVRGLDMSVGLADHLVSEAVYLRDPDGLGIEIYADRPRDEWAVREREILMTTDPLDAQALMSVAGSTPWRGMPSGAVMGHIHLHVGDLSVAEAFYHETLGFDKMVWSYPGALFLSADGYHHHLGLNTWGEAKASRDADARLLEWSLRLPHAEQREQVARRLKGAGYSVAEEDDGWIANDPWGTKLQVT